MERSIPIAKRVIAFLSETVVERERIVVVKKGHVGPPHPPPHPPPYPPPYPPPPPPAEGPHGPKGKQYLQNPESLSKGGGGPKTYM